MSACQSCCEQQNPSGFAQFEALVVQYCGCTTGAACNADCEASCGDAGTAQSTACMQCLEAQGAQGASSSCVLNAAGDPSCTGDCATFVACGIGC